MNNANIVGNLTREAFYSDKGQTPVVKFTVAVDSGRKNKQGKSIVDYVPVTAFNKTAENIHKYTTKGSKVAVEGKLSTSMIEDKSGTKQFQMNVVVKEIYFEDSKQRFDELKQKNDEQTNNDVYSPKNETEKTESSIEDKDLPWI